MKQMVGRTGFTTSPLALFTSPNWCTTDAEIQLISAVKPELSPVPFPKPGAAQTAAVHALFTAENSAFVVHSTSFFPTPLQALKRHEL